MKFTAALFVFFSTLTMAQPVQVPHKMQFAGMTLTIRDDARREIQKDVDLLMRSPKHLAIKADRAKTYFPIIEKIFEEERVPDDFKYLVLQESALISNAVSVSNAVGFWQFKDFTAIEMGLRVDQEIDERMNIVSSSRAAAKYFKKNNYYFNNWLYALQAYQMGAGGVLQSVKDFDGGEKHMEITSKTYWYVKKFLAHKVAYENIVKGTGELIVIPWINNSRKSVAELAREFALPEAELKAYNTWVLTEFIPGDKPYSVSIPTLGDGKALTEAIAKATKMAEPVMRAVVKPASLSNEILNLNGIEAMKARENETSTTFVKRADIDLSYFLKCNDLSISDKLMAGSFYYLKKKKPRAAVPQHIARKGEGLWLLSQKYGVQLRKLRRYNQTESNILNEGSVVFLSGRKPNSNRVGAGEIAEVDPAESFNWAIDPLKTTITDEKTSEKADSTITDKNLGNVEVRTTATSEVISQSTEHIVMAGETLYSIAKRYQVGVMQIVSWNNLVLEAGIMPEQVLKLIAPPSANPQVKVEPDKITHQVKASDTLFSVARQYGVSIKELMDWNQKKDLTLTVGESLKIWKQQ